MTAVFFHIFPFGRIWEAAVNETMASIESSGLHEEAEAINLCVVKARQHLKLYESVQNWPWATVKAVGHDSFEWNTLKELWIWSQTAPDDALVLYVHTKGVTSRRWDCAADWRRYMTYFLVERWRSAIKVFDDPDIYAAGCNLKDKPPRKGVRHSLVKRGVSWRDLWHFAGNFWWARASAVRNLPEPMSEEADRIVTWKGYKRRLAAERWIALVGRNHLYNLHKAQVDLNSQRYPRKMYARSDQAV